MKRRPPAAERFHVEAETPAGWVFVASRADRAAAEAHARALEAISQREYRVRDGGAS